VGLRPGPEIRVEPTIQKDGQPSPEGRQAASGAPDATTAGGRVLAVGGTLVVLVAFTARILAHYYAFPAQGSRLRAPRAAA